MNQNAFASPDEIRARFSLAMSAMYQSEVPLYGELLDLVGRVNRRTLDADPALAEQMRASGDLQRLEEERHGAVRLGTAQELATMARLFAVMGMQPVSYYDLACAGVPVHATAFRAVDETSLERSPFRVFTSLLRLELIDNPALRQQAAQILAGRQIFTAQALAMIEQFERAGGLTEEQAGVFIREALQTFRWHRQARVSAEVYQQLQAQHRLIADVVAFQGPHINHLTPCTLDIDAVQAGMPERGMHAKELVEGPPARRCPILLRQTSFKALDEAVQFGCGTPGWHSARFGEIEQRGAALTAKGRALYDLLLGAARERCRDVPPAEYAQAYELALHQCFADFPDDFAVLRREGLVYGRYQVTEAGRAARHEVCLAGDLEALLAAGLLRWQPQLYEDFLPVSAAGIFQSNLGDSSRDAYDQSASRAEFERALGRPVLDEMALYAQVHNASLLDCAQELGIQLT